MDLSDFIQPLIIEKSEDFKPRDAKARFVRICDMLSKQAFWLGVFEFIAKHEDAIDGIEFDLASPYSRKDNSVSAGMWIIPKPGADPKKIAKAQVASVGAFSKIRGKIPQLSSYSLAAIARAALPGSGIARLAEKEAIFARALGPDLYSLRMSCIESKELDQLLSANVSAALSGRAPSKRL